MIELQVPCHGWIGREKVGGGCPACPALSACGQTSPLCGCRLQAAGCRCRESEFRSVSAHEGYCQCVVCVHFVGHWSLQSLIVPVVLVLSSSGSDTRQFSIYPRQRFLAMRA
ncbi:hypothetical protein BS78_08G121100 [Paspalum vaginatum]|nr:hypothetical protein BS78_08G121100 [Paspalum vaginatum]